MIKIKKTPLAAFVLLSTQGFAGTMGDVEQIYSPRENVYLGAGVGASFNQDKLNARNIVTNDSVTRKENHTRALGNVFLGYGHTFRDVWYLGGEANIYFPNRVVSFNHRPGVTDTTIFFNDQYTLNDTITVDLLPGYRLSNSNLIYARVGMDFRDATLNQQPTTIDPNWYASASQVGGRFGAGLTHALTDHFAASVDYFYTYLPTFGSYWPDKHEQFNLTSSSNYIGASLLYTI